MRAYAAALEGLKAQPNNIGMERTLAGSVNALIVSYYRLVFPTLKPSTQAKRRAILERFRSEHGNKQVGRLEHVHVASMIAAKADTPEAANNLLKVLRHLLDHAVALKMIAQNPALGVRRFKRKGDGIHTWSEGEVAQFEAQHALGSRAHLALALVPRTNMTFLLTDRGAPFTKEWFGNWMRDRCDEAGLPQCSSHGLRKLAATRLANAGCSEREIMAITGHKSVAEVSRYTKARDQAKLAEQTMARLRKRTNRDEKIVPRPTPVDKTSK